jgi:hypothetical protein
MIAGSFANVHLLATDNDHWMDTTVQGTLQVMLLEWVGGLPIVAVRIHNNGNLCFEYELPLNFNFEPNLTNMLSAVYTHIQGECFGFLFESARDRAIFDKSLELMNLQLIVDPQRIQNLKQEALI